MLLGCFTCKNAYVMQGCRAGTGAAGAIRSEPKSESDIKSGAATALRKVVSNSYQTYRTTSGMKCTHFRLSVPLDQPLLPSSSPRKRRLHSLQNSKRLFRTIHLICMWQNHATGAIRQINHRPPEWATVHIPNWPASDLRAFETRGQNNLWDFTTFAHYDFIEVCCLFGYYLGLKEHEKRWGNKSIWANMVWMPSAGVNISRCGVPNRRV